jgi:hypothetical protein
VNWRAAAGAAVLLAAGLCGCSTVQTLSFPEPPSTVRTVPVRTPTLPTNLPSIVQHAVPGATTTTLPTIGPGGATIQGTVFGPQGPVGGATIQAERIVGNQVTGTETTSAGDGSWSIGAVLGGRYRVRAWQSPSLDTLTPQIFFLGDTETHSLTLQMDAFTGPDVAAAVSPAHPQVGATDNLLIQVTNPTVGPDGVVRDQAAVGTSVTLAYGPNWQILSGNPLATDAHGRVVFQVSCLAPGDNPLSAAVGGGLPVGLQVPACSPPPTPPSSTSTTTPGSPDTLFPCPPGTGASTTTTTLAFGSC